MSFKNLTELHRTQANRLASLPALRYKQHGVYYALTWSEYREQAQACAAALVAAGIAPGDRVGLLSENRVEWLIADMGILAAAAVNVPPHAPLTAAQVQFQLADAEVRWLFVSNRDQLAKIESIRAELPAFKGVVVFDSSALRNQRTTADNVLTWDGFLQRGRAALANVRGELARREVELSENSLATIMYTSGTTGMPKGVMLTHGNLLSNAIAMDQASPRRSSDVVLSWLPYSHIYARTVDHYLSIVTGSVMWLAVSADTVVENLAEAQPTHVACVPRFYEKVLAAVSQNGVSSADSSAARILRSIFGPNIYWLSSGGAPLPLPVAEAYQRAGLLLLQGYGLTECAPVISFNSPDCYRLNSVGRPIPGVEVRIADDGEILTRGPHVMPGYWKNSQATADAIRDGWLHTGDLGHLDADGFLYITGRKKDLLVLSNGKKVVPTHIEGLLLGDPCIDQAVVYGEGRNYIVALIVPHWPNLRNCLRERGSSDVEKSEEELASSREVHDLLAENIRRCCANVSTSETVKKFIVLPKPFSVEAEELTVSLKLRRNIVFGKYKDRLCELYQ